MDDKEFMELKVLLGNNYNCADRLYCLDRQAKALIEEGYHKTIWHKVVDGDLPKPYQNIWFIDERTNLGFSGYYNDIDKIFISDFDNNFCIKKDEVIAWTGLPEYKE